MCKYRNTLDSCKVTRNVSVATDRWLSGHLITIAKHVYAYHSFRINSFWFIEHFSCKFVTIHVQFVRYNRYFGLIHIIGFESKQILKTWLIPVQKKKRVSRKTRFFLSYNCILNAMKGFCFKKKTTQWFFIYLVFLCCEYRFHLLHFFLHFLNWIHYDNFYFSVFHFRVGTRNQRNNINTNTIAFKIWRQRSHSKR